AMPPSRQALMLDGAGAEAAAQAMAVHSSSVHVGAALGGAVGGAVVAAAPGLLPAAAALAVAPGLLLGPPARRAPGRRSRRRRPVRALGGAAASRPPGGWAAVRGLGRLLLVLLVGHPAQGVAGLAVEGAAERVERGEPDRLGPPVLQHGDVGGRDADRG